MNMQKARKKHAYSLSLFSLCIWGLTFIVLVQEAKAVGLDSLNTLPEVVVEGRPFNEVIPSQKLTADQLKALNSFSVADAIRYFSGIQLKDYGGIGGLKTVNIRSLGTNHAGIFYDGIQLGNAQNGQIDLGKFSLDNMEEVVLYNGQKSEILQSARDYGSSGSVYLRSRTPHFVAGKTTNWRAFYRTGSFGLLNPSLLFEKKLTRSLSLSVNGEWIKAHGRYKFRYKRVNAATKQAVYDTTAVRQNGDVHSIRVETGLYGNNPHMRWRIKNYFYRSERGIPGAVINNKWTNIQRQWDTNIFTQGSLEHRVNDKIDLLLNGKYSNDYMRYLNPDTTLLLINNTFRQQEGYFSLASKYVWNHQWETSISSDIQYNTLSSNMDGFVYPTRYTWLIALASSVNLDYLKAQASLLSTRVYNSTKKATSAPNDYKLTPALFLSFTPNNLSDLSIRAFFKQIFRMPTFNDLYYTDIGNIALKPEFTYQYNLGLHYTGNRHKSAWIRHWQVQADAYFNKVTNKIVAVPKGSGQYRWMMMNIGKVHIKGVDLAANTAICPLSNTVLNLKATYTYQRAQDFTRRKSPILMSTTYGGQIPYIPWHSGSFIANLAYRSWQLNYSFIYVGKRYHSSANIPTEYEQPWYTSDIALIKQRRYRNTDIRVSFEVNNLLNQDYEVVLNYPMPKRNYKLTLSVEL